MSDPQQSEQYLELLSLRNDPSNPRLGEALVKFLPYIRKVVRHAVPNDTELEDLVQDMFLEIWKSLASPNFKPEIASTDRIFFGWMRTAIKNRIKDRVRQRRRRPTTSSEYLDQFPIQESGIRLDEESTAELERAILRIKVSLRFSSVVAAKVFPVLGIHVQRFLVVADRHRAVFDSAREVADERRLMKIDPAACRDADRYAKLPFELIAGATDDELAEMFGLLEGLSSARANQRIRKLASDRFRYGRNLQCILGRHLGIRHESDVKGGEA